MPEGIDCAVDVPEKAFEASGANAERASEAVKRLYMELVKEYASMLKDSLGNRLRSVCLFGSVARGDFEAGSDVDLLIVVEGLPEDVGNRHSMFRDLRARIASSKAARGIRELGYSAAASEIYLTPEEVEKHPPIMLDIVEDGIIIYDRDGFLRKVLEDIRAKLRELGARRMKIGKGWYWVLKPDAKLGEEIRV
ncbi:MAG: nucleotidyltransferase domain-containing protein [Candidatus Bathyarchaeia archaeon]